MNLQFQYQQNTHIILSTMTKMKLWGCLSVVFGVLDLIDCTCKFGGLVATCDMVVGGMPLIVSARINHCHFPIDITFQVHGESEGSFSGPWRYTYVTTNQPESREITERVTLAMMCATPAQNVIRVHAQFLVDGADGDQLKFVDQEVRLPDSQANCVLPSSSSGPGYIAYTIIAVAAAGLLAVLVALSVLRARRAQAQDQDRLVNNMEKCVVDSTVVQYVVPGPETADIRLYVSTSDGLKPVGTPKKNSKVNGSPTEAETEFGSGPPSDQIGLVNNAFDMEEEEMGNKQDAIEQTNNNICKSNQHSNNSHSTRKNEASVEGPAVDRSKKRRVDPSQGQEKEQTKAKEKARSKDQLKKVAVTNTERHTGAIPKKNHRPRNHSTNSSGSRGSSGSSSASTPIR